jgi:hypothetical protein
MYRLPVKRKPLFKLEGEIAHFSAISKKVGALLGFCRIAIAVAKASRLKGDLSAPRGRIFSCFD